MGVILGINAHHADAAACLVVEGKLVAAVAEERLGGRKKHAADFPENAIRYVLKAAGCRLRDVTHVATARNIKSNKSARAVYAAKNPVHVVRSIAGIVRRYKKNQVAFRRLSQICDEFQDRQKYVEVVFEHHLAHIASAYYLSPFEEITAGFSYDSSGDFASLMAARCEGSRIEIVDRVTLPHSLGIFYTALCQLIGFRKFGEEYKVMGLAAYGEDRYREPMQHVLQICERSWFKLRTGFFRSAGTDALHQLDDRGQMIIEPLYTSKLVDLLGLPRDQDSPLTSREIDIACSTQARFEEAALHCLNKLHSSVKTNRLALAGGCALNGVVNSKISRRTPFTEAFIQPAASDDGTCIGAAFLTWHQVLGRQQRFHMNHSFWGPEYTDAELRQVAEASCALALVCRDEDALVEAAADMLDKGLVIGWYQGRSEWGPRALGNRSILANPTVPNMKDIINSKIKRRELFRPFAPSVLKEDLNTYFEDSVESPFMMHVVKFRREWRARLPAVTHVDGTGRLQSVDRERNLLFYKLISAFKRRSGVGMLLNTSFNENEPIVDTPQQAYSCFNRTNIDALFLGRYVLKKT